MCSSGFYTPSVSAAASVAVSGAPSESVARLPCGGGDGMTGGVGWERRRQKAHINANDDAAAAVRESGKQRWSSGVSEVDPHSPDPVGRIRRTCEGHSVVYE